MRLGSEIWYSIIAPVSAVDDQAERFSRSLHSKSAAQVVPTSFSLHKLIVLIFFSSDLIEKRLIHSPGLALAEVNANVTFGEAQVLSKPNVRRSRRSPPSREEVGWMYHLFGIVDDKHLIH